MYVKALKGVVKSVHDETRDYVLENYTPPKVRQDSSGRRKGLDLKGVSVRWVKEARNKVGTHFDRMSGDVKKRNATQFQQLIPISTHDMGVDAMIGAAREWNLSLISNASEEYIDQVEAVLDKAFTEGLRVEELLELLIERASVSESRAELIARDQTLKLNGQITKTRCQNAGIDRYTWSTSQDDRVRPSHEELEGLDFDFSDPPDVGNPGDDFQCRCVAVPIVPDYSGDDEDEDTTHGESSHESEQDYINSVESPGQGS